MLLRFLTLPQLAPALGALCLLFCIPSPPAAAASVDPTTLPVTSHFTVAGTLKFGAQTAQMTHLYFRRQKNDDGPVLVYIFSDHPLPAFALEDRQRLAALARRKTFMGLYVEIDDSGTMKATELFDDDGSFSGSWSFEPIPDKKSSHAGHISSDGEKEFFDKTFNVDLTFDVSSSIDERWGGSDLYATKSTGLPLGRAEGWMERHDQKTSLVYAIAVSETGLFGDSGQRKLILSAAPVTEKILGATAGPEQALHTAGIAFLRVGLDAKNNIESVMVPAEDGAPINFSSNQWDIELSPSTAGEFDGTVQTTASKEDNPDFPHFNLRFHATTSKTGAASPITAENGKALPLDGGAPGKAYRDYLVSLKNAKTIEELLPLRIAETADVVSALPANQHAAILEFMKLEVQAGYKIVGGFTTDNQATLWVEGGLAQDHLEGRVNLVRDGNLWRVGLEAFRNPPPAP